jgi:hypothetical protein
MVPDLSLGITVHLASIRLAQADDAPTNTESGAEEVKGSRAWFPRPSLGASQAHGTTHLTSSVQFFLGRGVASSRGDPLNFLRPVFPEFVFIPKGKGVLVMPVPELKQLAGIAKGANKDGYRDRRDRY